MGCGSSHTAPPERGTATEDKKGNQPTPPEKHPNTKSGQQQGAQPQSNVADNNTTARPAAKTTPPSAASSNLPGCKAGKDKYMALPCMRACDQDGKLYYLACFCNDFNDLSGLSVVCRSVTGTVWMRSMTDEEVETWKVSSNIQMAWSAFWRSLNAAFVKSEPPRAIATTGNKRRLDIPLRLNKDKSALISIELANCGDDDSLTHQHFFLPFLSAYTKRNQTPPPNAEVLNVTEGRINIIEVTLESREESIETKGKILDGLRAEAKECQAEQGVTTGTVDRMEKQVRKAIKFCEHGREVHHLDGLYNEGGARSFQHIPWAIEHEPVYVDTRDEILNLLVEKYESVDGSHVPKTVIPTDPKAVEILKGVEDQATVWRVLESLDRLDENGFDAFELDELTKGGMQKKTPFSVLHSLRSSPPTQKGFTFSQTHLNPLIATDLFFYTPPPERKHMKIHEHPKPFTPTPPHRRAPPHCLGIDITIRPLRVLRD